MADESFTNVPNADGDNSLQYIPESLRKLPEPVTQRPVKRRQLRSIDAIRASLNEDQQAGFDKLMTFVGNDSSVYYLIQGFAGTGKTTLITAFSEAYIQSNKIYDIAVTATTNKAVVVLADKAEFLSYRVTYKTIHSLLQLKQRYDDYGNIFFDTNGNGNSKLPSDIKVVIIDEASMIDRKLHAIILRKIQELGIKVIFCGDFYQIPPVGEREALISSPEIQQEMCMENHLLDKVVRQAEGNPIIQLATYTREHENDVILRFDYKNSVTKDGSIILLDRTDKDTIFAVIKHLIANDYFSANPDYAKVLAWRNDTVNRMNHIIRKMIYGEAARTSLLLPGEKLIASKPILDLVSRTVLFTNNAEFEVVAVNIITKKVKDIDLKCFKTAVVQKMTNPETMKITERREKIDILHPDSQYDFDRLTGKMKGSAIQWSGTQQGKVFWRMYYEVLEHFADVKYNYALTSHKAQGSTFRNAIVLEKDIRSNPTMPERNRLLYVAYTRPSTNLIIVR